MLDEFSRKLFGNSCKFSLMLVLGNHSAPFIKGYANYLQLVL